MEKEARGRAVPHAQGCGGGGGMSAVAATTRRAVRSRSRALITDNDRKILEQEGQQRLFVEVTNQRTVDQWVELVRAELGRSVEAIIAAGRHLCEAKDAVDHGEWLTLLKRVGIGYRKAQILMFIAKHPIVSNAKHVSHLPPCWGTLWALASLPRDVLEAKLADGTITPDIERREVKALSRHEPEKPEPEESESEETETAEAADDTADNDDGDASPADPKRERIEKLIRNVSASWRHAHEFFTARQYDDAISKAEEIAAAWTKIAKHLRSLKASTETEGTAAA
jgi:hypothetical protein